MSVDTTELLKLAAMYEDIEERCEDECAFDANDGEFVQKLSNLAHAAATELSLVRSVMARDASLVAAVRRLAPLLDVLEVEILRGDHTNARYLADAWHQEKVALHG